MKHAPRGASYWKIKAINQRGLGWVSQSLLPRGRLPERLTRIWHGRDGQEESRFPRGGYCSDPKYPVQSQCICIKQLSHLLCPSVLRHVGPFTLLTQSKRPLGGEKQAPIGHALTTRPNMQCFLPPTASSEVAGRHWPSPNMAALVLFFCARSDPIPSTQSTSCPSPDPGQHWMATHTN